MKFVRIRRQLLELSCNRQTLSDRQTDRQTDKGKTDIFGACNNPFFPRHRVVIKKHRVAEADKLTQHVTDRQTDGRTLSVFLAAAAVLESFCEGPSLSVTFVYCIHYPDG